MSHPKELKNLQFLKRNKNVICPRKFENNRAAISKPAKNCTFKKSKREREINTFTCKILKG